MSDSSIISVEALSKRYRLGATAMPTDSLRELMMAGLRAPLNLFRSRKTGSSEVDYLWALKDVSFTVERGEVVGVIGRNGSGKSTMLKLISRITVPTSGRVELRGRVASLLEVGTGFHPELSGRENIWLSGAILGMSRLEIQRKFDEIVAFSEVERFLDTPVKRYSSGMRVRLAFAVAAHLEPEILLIDEVLAVGDTAFQKKSLGKMGQVAQSGRTVLFVSHNLQAVSNLCTRGLLLNHGQLTMDGPTGDVVGSYLQSQLTEADAVQDWDDPDTAPGNDKLRLLHASITAAEGDPDAPLTIRSPVRLRFGYELRRPDTQLLVHVGLSRLDGTVVFNAISSTDDQWRGTVFAPGRYQTETIIPGDLLNEGFYRVHLLFVDADGSHIYNHDEVGTITVADVGDRGIAWYGSWKGTVRPRLDWQTERLGS